MTASPPDPIVPELAPPSADGLQQAYEVASRWLPAFVAGRRADEDLYQPDASTWHNVGEWEAPIKATPSRRRRMDAGAVLHLEDVRCRVFDGGFVVQATTAGTNSAGAPVRVPTVLVVTLVDGKIARFEEYTDSRAAEALFGPEGAEHEHFDD
jgi:ketosteroid isomerase-like protein